MSRVAKALVGTGEVFRQGRPAAGVDYGIDAPRLQTITFPLDVATTNREIAMTADFLWAIASKNNDLTANVQVKIQDGGGDAVPFTLGLYLTWPMSRVFISWAAQAGKSLTLMYGKFNSPEQQVFIQNAALALSSVTVTGLVSTADKPTTLVTLADVALGVAVAGAIVPATATQRHIFLNNVGGNPARIGDLANVGAARGYPLAAGSGLFLETTAQVAGFSTLGTTIAVMLEQD